MSESDREHAGAIGEPGGARSPGSRLVLVLALVFVAVWCLVFWPFTIDDTYITARYAENLAAGHGPVFNVGERVEGFSCPAWVGTLALAALAGLDTILVAKGLGVVASLCLVALLPLALARAGVSPRVRGAATLWVAGVAGLSVYAGSGMETAPFAFLVLALVALPLLALPPRWRAWTTALAIVGVGTMRPEGALLALAVGGWWLVRDADRGVRLAVVGAFVALAVLLAVRVVYFGAWLPNTYLAKPSTVLAEASRAEFLASIGIVLRALVAGRGPGELLVTAGGVGVLALVVVALVRSRMDVRLVPALIALGVGWVFTAYASYDWMPAARFAWPFVPPLVLLAAWGADALMTGIPARTSRAALAVVATLWLAFQANALAELRARYASGETNPALDARAFLPIGEWLSRHAAPDDAVLAYEIGAVGYISELEVVDHEGLVNCDVAEIVHEAGGYMRVRFGEAPEPARRIVELCVAQRPEWFLVRSARPFPATPGSPLPPGVANEPIQNALIQALGPSMILRASFDLPAARGVPDRYHLLGRDR